mmetsp:Transcript_111336/g.153848  ORF Transcript_111336/g.153848 Transcript_111336/m.153848 type:complete len:108 (+) Transcript_111336:27-350(+)
MVENCETLLGKKTNYLLVKDGVGKSKPTTRKLPKENFAFGKPDPKSETAASVTQNWSSHVKTTSKDPNPRDFKKLNKMCIKDKAVDAKANREFRNYNDARIPYGVVT